ncbi:MAG: PaaI family thioesterase [Actinomycetes bacterium]
MSDFEARRTAVEDLAEAVRDLAEATVSTDIDPDEIRSITAAVRDHALRLGTATDDSPFSGLVRQPVDYALPENPMPINPIIGACSPNRPDVHLRFVDGSVQGTATLTKRFTGPPGFAHGGITAMLADQLVALASGAVGVRCLTKALHVRFRRPVPIGALLTLQSRCAVDDDIITVEYSIEVDGTVAVEGTGEVVRYEHFAEREAARRAGD